MSVEDVDTSDSGTATTTTTATTTAYNSNTLSAREIKWATNTRELEESHERINAGKIR